MLSALPMRILSLRSAILAFAPYYCHLHLLLICPVRDGIFARLCEVRTFGVDPPNRSCAAYFDYALVSHKVILEVDKILEELAHSHLSFLYH